MYIMLICIADDNDNCCTPESAQLESLFCGNSWDNRTNDSGSVPSAPGEQLLQPAALSVGQHPRPCA